jgi:hypothetical protein
MYSSILWDFSRTHAWPYVGSRGSTAVWGKQVQPGVDACIRVEIATGENRNYQFKTHPNIDKQLYTRSNVLGLKDPARPFPTEGAPVGILKWRMQVNFFMNSKLLLAFSAISYAECSLPFVTFLPIQPVGEQLSNQCMSLGVVFQLET